MTTTEKKLVETYRAATSDQKKIALKILKGEYDDKLTNLMGLLGGTGSSSGSSSNNIGDSIGDALGNLIGGLFGGKK